MQVRPIRAGRARRSPVRARTRRAAAASGRALPPLPVWLRAGSLVVLAFDDPIECEAEGGIICDEIAESFQFRCGRLGNEMLLPTGIDTCEAGSCWLGWLRLNGWRETGQKLRRLANELRKAATLRRGVLVELEEIESQVADGARLLVLICEVEHLLECRPSVVLERRTRHACALQGLAASSFMAAIRRFGRRT